MLKVAIRRTGLSMREFSEEQGLNYSYMSSIVSGAFRPSMDLAVRLGKRLNLDPMEIRNYRDSLK